MSEKPKFGHLRADGTKLSKEALAAFKAQLPITRISERARIPKIVTQTEEGNIWIVPGERHNLPSYRRGRASDALDFYLEHGFKVIEALEIDGYRELVEHFYRVLLPEDGSIGICSHPESAGIYLIHDAAGKILAQSTIHLFTDFPQQYLIETY